MRTERLEDGSLLVAPDAPDDYPEMTPERAARISALASLPRRTRYELGRALRREHRARNPEQTPALAAAEAKRARKRARNLARP